jgi:hypothetical protein
MPLEVLTTMRVTLRTCDRAFLDIPAGFEGGFATERELLEWAQDPKADLDVAFVRDALAKGDRCYALREGTKLAAYGWYSQKPTHITPALLLHFPSGYVYMYKGLTAKAYRGKRLHAVGMANALELYTDEGAAGLVSYVDSTNFASLQSCDRMGYETLGVIVLVTVAGRTLSYAPNRDPDTRMSVEVLA